MNQTNLHKNLTEIKGRLFEYFTIMYHDMNCTKDKIDDYDEYYNSIINVVNNLKEIYTVSDLDRFCNDYGLNDFDDFHLSFYNLAKHYLAPKFDDTPF